MSLVGLLVYMWVITTYQFPLGTAAMVVALFGLLMPQGPFRLPAPVASMLVFLGWCALGLTQSAYPDSVREATFLYLKLCLVAFALANTIRDRAQLRFFLVFWLLAFGLFPIRGAYLTYFAYGATWNRAAWVQEFANPNQMAAMALLMLAIGSVVARTDRNRWIRYGALGGSGLLFLLIFLTQSRGGIIALGVFTLLLAVEWYRSQSSTGARRKRVRAPFSRIAQGVLVAVIATIAVVKFSPSGTWERMARLNTISTAAEHANESDDLSSTAQRLEIWKVGLAIVQANPLLGAGFGAYPEAHRITASSGQFSPIAAGGRDTHSTYINVAAETGIPGLLLFAVIVLTTWRASTRAIRRLRAVAPADAFQVAVARAGMIGFLVAGIWATFVKLQFFYIYLVLVWLMAATYLADAERRGLLRRR